MHRLTPLFLALSLSGCSMLQNTPHPAPPVSDQPQEISRNQTAGLQKMETISVMVRGSPMDVESEIKAKAAAMKADYYVILLDDETVVPGQRYGQAILYRQ
ncbi:biofilm peroxide resistance protein BsmA [Pseudescherichia vulneris]|uniref:Lipoprotein BsmA n=1 Tax=Pseudescherichia vulneris NBRC 102420 TaxID=1115515 RepID=A0A090VP71_PSEVU|nr:biofilm peroxide resistance protein BsmA [Pseudescherichia vulneris]GAL56907.1 lipoprotein BsmA [Pseudescherichia vulneris NBRC 102420]STQ61695.1 putative lipoprotein [Pseudescherichia vulneris]HBC81867.1 biofilm peroxide resistance protein BsmA [Escherichia sp.]